MFSEYASKFINQSQARISQHLRGNSVDASEAPLFYSATDKFIDEDDHNRERDTLKASRRNFGAIFGLGVHEEQEEGQESGDSFLNEGESQEEEREDITGLAASWKPSASMFRGMGFQQSRRMQESMDESETSESGQSDSTTRPIRSELLGQQSMADGDGEYFYNPGDMEMSTDQPPDDLHIETPFIPPQPSTGLRETPPAPILQGGARQPNDSLPRPVTAPPVTMFSHDSTWAAFYALSMAGMFASALVIWLGTEAPINTLPLRDTIYSALRSAFPLLISDTILAVGISILWLILMKHALQPFIYLLLFTVPIAMFTLFLVPLIQSYRGQWDGNTLQDKAMRWGSIGPALIGVWWTYKMWKERQSLHRAVSIIALSGKIVRENPGIVAFSFSVLAGFIAFTFVWVLMFTRVFLRGNTEGSLYWIIPSSSWWLGAYYVFMFLWTWGVFSGVQRATMGAIVSQWYFHRYERTGEQSTKSDILAALSHTFSTLIGTVCLSSFVSLVCRLPLLILPRSLSFWIQWFFFLIVPGPLLNLVLPLTLTYSSIHSVPLSIAARNSSRLPLDSSRGHPYTSYRMAKMILSATRLATCLSMGIGGWIYGARQEILAGSASGAMGSLYGYIVGLVAGAVGWVVVGGIEGVAGMIVDACFVCFVIDFEFARRDGMGGHCGEAWLAFGERM